ncbi:DUF4249 domain-containing protein [Dyadobacter sp. CY323]|uniref:DUF4249 domain-containing protein n=1 Tax=Dyadobacter sp. CY323 TaxID=2907302 RepID=UPI001F33DD2B|nr:DUF4249 domain-containing protein [Dyadobacter sp. CY323]MCE6988363.1 DUF4249 domain-containing protein [Dyadobacter sp. CY323]
MRIRNYTLLTVTLAMLAVIYSCVEPFSPPEVNSDENYLVVDGFLNVGNDTSRIELRRTQNVNQNTNPVSENGAKVTVEVENGERYDFTETGDGLYILPPRSFSTSNKYRLRINTGDGEEYLSDYVAVSLTPAIDSVTYKYNPVQDAVTFYVNTHDEQGKTQFYRWKFDETWEYVMAYYSAILIRNDSIVVRPENINRCWNKRNSGSILLGSTVKLSSDIIKDLPLALVPVNTNKLHIKYSIRVKQYGLSRDAFEYWTSLSKTTQGTGSLFDPQPSQVTGNILNTKNSKTLVFGYFSASTETSKRLTIEPRLGTFPRCIAPDTLPISCKQGEECAYTTSSMLLMYWGLRSDSVLVGPASCTDCRLEGGTTERPSYW